jgi:SAM-dependent methyltransferase
MKLKLEECDARSNHLWLIGEFASVLASYEPSEVLDVGCGSGMLLRACRGRGVLAKGVDQAGPRLKGLTEDGFDVKEGSAYELPLSDGSVDWISLRHVPHHLDDPARAFRELLRVADRGILLAEPFYDAGIASQRGAAMLDSWEKRQHRRGGMYHAESYDLEGLLALMPSGFDAGYSIEVHRTLRLRSASLDEARSSAEVLTEGLLSGDPECISKRELFDTLKDTGLSWNGSMLVALVRL